MRLLKSKIIKLHLNILLRRKYRSIHSQESVKPRFLSNCFILKNFNFYSSSRGNRKQFLFDSEHHLLNKEYITKNVTFYEQSKLANKYLRDEVASNLVDRLYFIKRRFDVIVDYLSGEGHLVNFLDKEVTDKVERTLLQNEEILGFEQNSCQIIMSNLGLHFINDLTGVFNQINKCLKNDGVFLASMLGGDTLFELRTSIQQAEMERTGGIMPRISPFTTPNDISNLLQRANFNMITVDVEEIVIRYPTIFELMEDLRFMYGSNVLFTSKQSNPSTKKLQKQVLASANAIYQSIYGNNEEGYVPATFQIGWKPDKSQPKPLKRGSAKLSLKEALSENNKNP